MKKAEYKKHVEAILNLNFNQKNTMFLIQELNEVVRFGYDVSCITEDGMIILGGSKFQKLMKKKKKKD
jgi:hypothetical protein